VYKWTTDQIEPTQRFTTIGARVRARELFGVTAELEPGDVRNSQVNFAANRHCQHSELRASPYRSNAPPPNIARARAQACAHPAARRRWLVRRQAAAVHPCQGISPPAADVPTARGDRCDGFHLRILSCRRTTSFSPTPHNLFEKFSAKPR
jgi:hypothetical protein